MSDELTMPDGELLERWRRGDRRAGEALVRRHHLSVDRFFVYQVGSDCEDLVQETFLGLLNGLPGFRNECGFRTLLFSIARRKLVDHLRKIVVDKRRFDPSETSLVDLAPSPPSVLERVERDHLLVGALRRLPIDTQMMLELHYWEKLPIAEIAVVLDKPVNTIKTRMRRGRQQLDTEMQKLANSPAQLETTRRGLETWSRALQQELGASDED